MSDAYRQFLESKTAAAPMRGLKSIPPLSSHLFPFQRTCVEFNLLAGGTGLFLDCVAGETRIDSPFGSYRIDALAKRCRSIIVYSLDASGNVVPAYATSPFKKGRSALYTVTTAGGRSITATRGHRFLTEDGWRSLSALSVGAQLRVSDFDRLSSIAERVPLALPPNAQHCAQILEGSTDHYLPDSHQYGLRLPSVPTIYQAHVRRSADVHVRDDCYHSEDDQARRSSRIHHRRDNDRLSTRDSNCQDNYIAGEARSLPRAYDLERSEQSIHNDLLTASVAILEQSEYEPHRCRYSAYADDPYYLPTLDTVVSIQYLRTDDYYDLHVPGYENYFANGICSHNTGLGKTLCQLEYCEHARSATNGRALLLTPLAVAQQIHREGLKFGYQTRVIREQSEAGEGINIANYERLHLLEPSAYGVVSCDESSILKSFSGKTTRALISAFAEQQFKLSATATPAPNDHMELGQHSEFCGIMAANEMLSRFFINDTSTASQQWRLKGHAVQPFWDWMASWSRMAQLPSDLGYPDRGFVLRPIHVMSHRAQEGAPVTSGGLFGDAVSTTTMHHIKRQTAERRAKAAAELVMADPGEPWVVWVDTDYEADAVHEALKGVEGVAEVRGSMTPEQKERGIMGFLDGSIRVLVTKSSICGFGLNLQHCARTIFVGRSFSYESWYQAVRRFWRFGQQRIVEVHLIVAEGEDQISRVIDRKAADHTKMKAAMRLAMQRDQGKESAVKIGYCPTYQGSVTAMVECLNQRSGDGWSLYNGDCVSVLRQFPAESIDFSVYSPPFGSLFVYSASAADMGNSTDEQFTEHYGYLVREKYRLTKPGRLTAVHCSDLPMTKWKDGAVGIKDFSGDIIRLHQDAGWIMHSRRTIWKCPVVEMTRTKHVGLLYKQLQKDSSKSRGGMPDYLMTFIKPGDNASPINHTPEAFPLEQWQEWASPVWTTVQQSNVLNVKAARSANEERHLCPLQLDVIERALVMWSNPGDIVLSPFAGIGSEGYGALKAQRRFIGVELKEEYFRQAADYLHAVASQHDMFAGNCRMSEA